MKETKPVNASVESDESHDQTLKGTMLSVSIVGAVIVAMWVAVFCLYMIRV